MLKYNHLPRSQSLFHILFFHLRSTVRISSLPSSRGLNLGLVSLFFRVLRFIPFESLYDTLLDLLFFSFPFLSFFKALWAKLVGLWPDGLGLREWGRGRWNVSHGTTCERERLRYCTIPYWTVTHCHVVRPPAHSGTVLNPLLKRKRKEKKYFCEIFRTRNYPRRWSSTKEIMMWRKKQKRETGKKNNSSDNYNTGNNIIRPIDRALRDIHLRQEKATNDTCDN